MARERERLRWPSALGNPRPVGDSEGRSPAADEVTLETLVAFPSQQPDAGLLAPPPIPPDSRTPPLAPQIPAHGPGPDPAPGLTRLRA